MRTMRFAQWASCVSMVAMGAACGATNGRGGEDSNPPESSEQALGTTSKAGVAAWSEEANGGFKPIGAHADASGNIVVVGTLYSTTTLGSVTLTPPDPQNEAVGVLMVDGNGKAKWGTVLGGTSGSATSPSDFAVNAAGQIVVGGLYSGAPTICGATFDSRVSPDLGGFVAVLSADGSCAWAMETSSPSPVMSVAFEPSGDVVVDAYVRKTGRFGMGGMNPPNVDPNGTSELVWLKGTGDHRAYDGYALGDASSTDANPKPTQVFDMAVDGSGNVFVAGSFQGTVDFHGRTLTASGPQSAFMLKLSNQGAYQWVHYYGSDAVPTAIAVNAKGDIAMGGNFLGSMHFGNGVEVTTPGSSRDGFVVKFDKNASPYFAKHLFGSMGQFALEGIAFDSYGQVVATGIFGTGTFQVGSYSFTASDEENKVWLTKLSMTQGTTLMAKAYGTSGAVVHVGSTTLTPDDMVPLAGEFFGTVDFGAGPMSDTETSSTNGPYITKLQH